MKKVNKFFTYTVMLYSLIPAYVQFVIILRELQKVLSQELKCLCSKITTVLSESMVPKTIEASLLHFYGTINKCIVQKCIYTLCTVDIYSTGPYVH